MRKFFRNTIRPSHATPGADNTTDEFFSDVGVTVGGPLWRDRMFFFGAIDRQWNNETLIAPEGFPLRSELGEVERERQATAYSGKLTYQINNVHRLDFSVFGDPSHGDMGPQRRSALTGNVINRTGPTFTLPNGVQTATGRCELAELARAVEALRQGASRCHRWARQCPWTIINRRERDKRPQKTRFCNWYGS